MAPHLTPRPRQTFGVGAAPGPVPPYPPTSRHPSSSLPSATPERERARKRACVGVCESEGDSKGMATAAAPAGAGAAAAAAAGAGGPGQQHLHLPPEVLSSEKLFETRWLRLLAIKYRDARGKQRVRARAFFLPRLYSSIARGSPSRKTGALEHSRFSLSHQSTLASPLAYCGWCRRRITHIPLPPPHQAWDAVARTTRPPGTSIDAVAILALLRSPGRPAEVLACVFFLSASSLSVLARPKRFSYSGEATAEPKPQTKTKRSW